MNAAQHLLQIHIHTADGSSGTFVQNEEDQAKWILRNFDPGRIFTRDKIIIADGHSLASFSTRRVVRMDLVSEQLSHWMLPSEIVNAVELSETEFQALLRNPELRVQWDPAQPPEASLVIFLMVELSGQPPLFLVMEIVGEPLADPLETVSPLLAAPALCFRMRSGGIAALNLAHLMCVTLFPGLQQPPTEAWPAQRLSGSQPQTPVHAWHDLADGRAVPPRFLQNAGVISDPSRTIPNENASTMEGKH